MQRPLQRPTRLAGRLDRLGLCALTLLFSVGLFAFLWRDLLAALPAGAAFSVLLLMTLHVGAQKSLQSREMALRRKLGGEMAVDSLLLQSASSAVSNAAGWLSQALQEPLSQPQPKNRGILARCGEETVWIACIQKHPCGKAGPDDVLSILRDARMENAQACVICATCAFSSEASAFCEDVSPRVRLLDRPALCALAGAAAPASNEQLRILGLRRRKQFRSGLWKTRIVAPGKARRYAVYGLGLLALYFFLKKPAYLLSSACCLALFLCCLRKRRKEFRL